MSTLPPPAKISADAHGHSSLDPLSTPVVERKKKEQSCLMFNLRLTKSSQKRKTARHCRMKSTIVSIGCYVWLLPTRLLANGDCLLNLYNSGS